MGGGVLASAKALGSTGGSLDDPLCGEVQSQIASRFLSLATHNP